MSLRFTEENLECRPTGNPGRPGFPGGPGGPTAPDFSNCESLTFVDCFLPTDVDALKITRTAKYKRNSGATAAQ